MLPRSLPRALRHRWVIRCSIGLASLYGLYVIGIGCILRFGVLEKITADWNDVQVRTRSGYSLWPGVFHLADAEVRIKDYNVEIEVGAKAARLDFGIVSLLRGTIHIESVRATGTRFRMVHRVTDGHGNRKRLAAFPDLGFGRPRVYDTKAPPYQPLPFRILVEHIDAEVDEVWMMEYRVLGRIHAQGGFEMYEDVRVHPSRVQADSLDVLVGERHAAQQFRCDIQGELGPFDRETAEAEDVLSVTEGHVLLSGMVSDLSAIEVYLTDLPLAVAGSGAWESELTISRGQLIDSRAKFHGSITPLTLAGHALGGSLTTTLTSNGAGDARVAAHWKGQANPGPTTLAEARIKADVKQDKLWNVALRNLELDAQGASFDDPEFLRKLHRTKDPPLAKLHDGRLQLKYAAASKLTMQTSGAWAFFPEEHKIVSCVFSLQATCQTEAQTTSCSKLEGQCLPATYAVTPHAPVKLDAKLRASQFSFDEHQLSGTLTLETSNPKPLLKRLADPNVFGAVGIALLPLGDLEATLHLSRRDETITGTVTQFSTGALRGEGQFVFAHALQSAWLLRTPLGRFGIEQSPQETSITALAGANWLEARRTQK